MQPVLNLEDGWQILKTQGIDRVFAMVDQDEKVSFTVQESSTLYTIVYRMCVQKPPHAYNAQLYERFIQTIEQRLTDTVLPTILAEKPGPGLVIQLVRKWEQHKIVSSWLCKFFMYLDRYYTGKAGRPTLSSICTLRFESVIFNAVQAQATATILEAIRDIRARYSVIAVARADARLASATTSTTSSATSTSPFVPEAHSSSTSAPSTSSSTSSLAKELDLQAHPWLKASIQLYLELEPIKSTVYRRSFESAFLRETTNFYTLKSAAWLAGKDDLVSAETSTTPLNLESSASAISCSNYVARAEVIFELESVLQNQLLHRCTEPFLVKALYDALLAKCYRGLFSQQVGGLKDIFAAPRERAAGELAQLFRLFAFLPDALPLIANEFKEHLIKTGSALQTEYIKGEEPAAAAAPAASSASAAVQSQGDNYIAALLDFHEAQYQTLSTSFQSHVIFSKAFKQAFENLVTVKTTPNGVPINHVELLAAYLDTVLKKPAQVPPSAAARLSEAAMDAKLESIARVFVYLADKDLFLEAAAKYLSKRLLNQRSESIEAERLMITKLKLRCGAQYTNRLETMVNDMRTSALQQAAFESWLNREAMSLGGIEFSVSTLTLGSWPAITHDPLNLPSELELCHSKFEQFYHSITSNRRLRWIHSLSSVIMRIKLGEGAPFEAVMTTFQAAILLLVNEHFNTGISIQEITDRLGVAPDTIKLLLRSLVSGQYPLLIKEPADSYSPSHLIKPNINFTTQSRRIRLPLPVAKSQSSTADRMAAAKVVSDRKPAIEAAIVRVMKKRKVLAHQALVSEVQTILQPLFPVESSDVKTEIEGLIARDFLERDRERPHVYHYLP